MGREPESFLAELRRYADLGADDERALRQLHGPAQPHFAAIADAFYETLSAHREAAQVFEGPAQIERLKLTLQSWLARLLAGPWDEDYFEQRARIGRVHVQVHLPQRYMFAAMTKIRLQLDDIASTAFADDPSAQRAARRALAKILDIELAIMLESYREEYVARVQHLERVELVELEGRLAEAQARYMGIVENGAALVVAADHQRRILLFNTTAEQTTGYERVEVLGADCLPTICHRDSRAIAREAFERAERDEPVAPFVARLTPRDGSERWIRWHVTRLLAAGTQLTCLIGIDLTEERNLERRTQRAEQLAGLGTLAAGLAHEIRNPLNAAQLQLMLVERRLNRTGREHRENALTAARVVKDELARLGGLVHDFLAFARPSELRLHDGDLAATLGDVLLLVEPEAAAAGVDLAARALERDAPGRFDEERMKQVVLNLLRNAIEAAGHGGEIDVSLERHDDVYTILIADTGPGLPDGINVFEPFATTKEGGTGLGLPIVHRIVTDHRGSVDVSRRNGRTIFAVTIPIAGP